MLGFSPCKSQLHLRPIGYRPLADLGPFVQDNPNHILAPIDEPPDCVEATVKRQSVPGYK
jgi:hypothetical protein